MDDLLAFDLIQKSNPDFLTKGFTETPAEMRIDHKFCDVKVEAHVHNEFEKAFSKFVYDKDFGKLELKLEGKGKIWSKNKIHLQKHLGLPKGHKLGTTLEMTYEEDKSNLKFAFN